MKNEIVYNSALAIWDPSELATLSVFYDGIVLPATSTSTSDRSVVLQRIPGSDHLFRLLSIKIGKINFVERKSERATTFGRLMNEWDLRYSSLYQDDVIRRLRSPPEDYLQDALTLAALESQNERAVQQLSDRILDFPTTIPSKWVPSWKVQIRLKELEKGGIALGAQIDELNLTVMDKEDGAVHTDFPELLVDMDIGKLSGGGRVIGVAVERMNLNMKYLSSSDEGSVIFIQEDYLQHILRSDIVMPGLFSAKAEMARTNLAEPLLAGSVFSFVLPKLSSLGPDQILEVRAKTASTREAFSLHIQSLSAEVDEALRGGEDIAKVKAHASSIAKSKLIPDYYEFKRQLGSERIGMWEHVLDATGILQIDFAPWTPKFYGALLSALAPGLFETVAARKERLTNRHQAFQFIRTLELIEP